MVYDMYFPNLLGTHEDVAGDFQEVKTDLVLSDSMFFVKNEPRIDKSSHDIFTT